MARFTSRYTIDVKTNCWNWDNKIVNGTNLYGRFMYQGVRYAAHVFSYMIHVGDIMKDSDTDHLCRNTRCVNPDHLENVTELENIRRARGVYNSDPEKCPKGHEYAVVGTDTHKDGLKCSECRRIKNRKHQWRKAGFTDEEILAKEQTFTSRINKKEKV